MPFLDPEELKPKLKEIFETVVVPQIKKANMKQTAVEWLIEILELSNPSKQYQAEIEQAKEMEKEQREKEFISGYKTRALASDLEFDEVSEIMAKRLFNGKL